jgi:exopolyphosphatase/guanosine-5'-triphosphate,3'-diphosphate pyrophosphatase
LSCTAVVSIGTNSTRLLIADLSRSPANLLAYSTGTRIGEGLRERGHLADDAMRRTLDTIRTYAQEIAGRSDVTGTYAIATSALRRADNGGAFSSGVSSILGVPLDILSGEQEAVASYRGARFAMRMQADARLGVADVGGGSSEFAVGSEAVPASVVSCEIGAVRLTEMCPALGGAQAPVDPAVIEHARAIAHAALGPIEQLGKVDRLVLVGGSATTAAALQRGDNERPAESEMTRDELQRLIDRLCALPLEARKELPGMNPQRADILPAGLIILDIIYQHAAAQTATVSQSDLLLGYLLIRRESDAPKS